MALSRQAQRQILLEDAKRRNARQALEDAVLGIGYDPLSDAAKIAAHRGAVGKHQPCLVRGIGTVNPPPPVRASRNSWDRGLAKSTTVGVADAAHPSQTPTVRVIHADGTEEIRDVSSFTGKNKRGVAVRVKRAATMPETAKLAIVGGHDFN